MRKIYFITATLLALLLSACGGGGDTGTFSGNSGIIISIPSCETYEDVQTGDVLEQTSANTSIKTVFNTNGSKKVCVLSGSANIIR